MAVAIKDAIVTVVPDPKTCADSSVRSAYQVSRLIRNAFAHAPFSPKWSIDPDCRDRVFEVPEVLKLDTTGLHDAPVDWRHYGGPLALLHLCRFVRNEILKDDPPPRTVVPIPRAITYQIGDLILTKAQIPADATRVNIEKLPDGNIPLPGGYVIRRRQQGRGSGAEA